MKSALILVISSFFLIGVFGDSVSVMEGDSVTLHTDLAEIQRADTVEWRLKEERIAKISMNPSGVISVWVSSDEASRDRLQLDKQTGDLMITKFRTTDSGQYKRTIKSTRGSSDKTFNVNIVISSGVKSASVTEGDSVTLRSGVNELQRDDVIRWRHQNILIADIINETASIHTNNSESLKLDNQTGSLTITNIKTEHAGDYEFDVTISSRSRYTIHKSFSVNVSDEVKSVSVMEGDSVTLNSNLTEIQRDNVIRWRFNKTIIAEIIKADHRFSTHDDVLDGRFRDRLKLDKQTGSLNITNLRNTDSGEYEVETSTNRFIVHKRISVTVNERKSVSVMEGDSVTLNSNLTELHRVDVIRWSFGKTTIAEIIKADHRFSTDDGPDGRFRGRVKLDNQTGSLTITNTRNTDSGEYEVEISTIRFIVHKRISVTVNETLNSVLLMERDSVTLHTGSSEIPRDDIVLWYGDKGVLITPVPGSVYPRWKNTVQNVQTGDLTIRNIRRDQSGDYKVHFINSTSRNIHRKFHIIISGVFSNETGGEKTVSVIKGNSVFLDTSVTEIQNGDLIEWLFGPQNITIAKTDGKNNSISYHKDVRFKNRLNLDKRTGDLTIKNSSSEDSGHYQLKIISSTYTIQKNFSVTVHSGQSSGAVAGIVITVLAAVAGAAVGGVFYHRRRSSKPKRSSEVNGQNHTSDKDVETELTEPAKAAEQQQFI